MVYYGPGMLPNARLSRGASAQTPEKAAHPPFIAPLLKITEEKKIKPSRPSLASRGAQLDSGGCKREADGPFSRSPPISTLGLPRGLPSPSPPPPPPPPGRPFFQAGAWHQAGEAPDQEEAARSGFLAPKVDCARPGRLSLSPQARIRLPRPQGQPGIGRGLRDGPASPPREPIAARCVAHALSAGSAPASARQPQTRRLAGGRTAAAAAARAPCVVSLPSMCRVPSAGTDGGEG